MPAEVRVIACSTCDQPLQVTATTAGTAQWGHGTEPADGHIAGVPVVVLNLSQDGPWWTAECAGVAGFPMRGLTSLAEARTAAWVLLNRVRPPQPVAEHVNGGPPGELAKDWPIKGGTLATPAAPPAGT
jgi:hypothetical protein